jgi:hypothetical protein
MNKPILSVSLFVKVTRGWNALFFCRVSQYFRAISSLCPYEEGSGPRRRDSRRRESTIRRVWEFNLGEEGDLQIVFTLLLHCNMLISFLANLQSTCSSYGSVILIHCTCLS